MLKDEKKKSLCEPFKPQLISQTCNTLNCKPGLIQEDTTPDQFNIE